MKRHPFKPTLTELVQTCLYVPAQWEGRTADDRPVYIRGRHRELSVRIGPAHGSPDEAVGGEELLLLRLDEADAIPTEDMLSLVGDVLDVSRLQSTNSKEGNRVRTDGG
jgi:hypothetical protein